jgi:hypothetical protein
VPTVEVQEEELPSNPNYPWGAASPLHRHHNVTGLGDGLLDWGKTAVHRLRTLFEKHEPIEGEHSEEVGEDEKE